MRSHEPRRNDVDDRFAAVLARLDDLDARTAAAMQHSDSHAAALLAAVDDRLQALLAHLDERTAVLDDLEVLPDRVIAEIGRSTASVLDRQVQSLVVRLADATDTLVHAEGRIEALARGSRGEARAVEERVGSALDQLGERVESAVREAAGRLAGIEEQGAALRDDLDEMAAVTVNAIEQLQVLQSALREAVEDGARRAAVAASDVRALREHLAPHLVALIEATTRRADADQAGFEAVLGRVDQLLARQEPGAAPPRAGG